MITFVTLPTTVRGLGRRYLALASAAMVLSAWMVWIATSGGYSASVWYPSALVALSLWAAVIIGGRRLLPETKFARIALLAFVALVVVNYLSILWAGSPGSALDASNELALYLLVAWILAVLPWTPGRLAVLLGLWSLGICAFCVFALVRATAASSLTLFFVDGRFAEPMQYSNATGALAVMGMWPNLILSSRRELPFWLRGSCLAVATFLAGFSTLPQSRAALLGLALTVPLALAVVSGRIWLLSRMLIVGGALAICLPRTIDLNKAVSSGGSVEPALHHAAQGMLLASVAAFLVGIVLALTEDRVFPTGLWRGHQDPRHPADTHERSPTNTRKFAKTGLAAAALIVVIGGAIAEPRVAQVVHTVVKSGNSDASTGSTRLLSASPEERFDYARVALHLFSGAPIIGIGDGNFGRPYDALRRFAKHSQYVHNLPLRVLSETGIAGMVLFLILVVALVVGLIRTARNSTELGRACAAIALAVSGYFLVHSCLDWVDEFPALAAPAIGLPLAALALGNVKPALVADRHGGIRRRRSLGSLARPRVAAGLGVIGGLTLLVALTTSYLSMSYVNRAFAIFRAHPRQAYHDLDVARALDPLSVNPVTSEGTVALYLGDARRSQTAFEQAVKQEDDWYPRLELALADAHSRHFGLAMRNIDAAARLDASDPLILAARMMIARHEQIDPIAFNQHIAQQGNSSGSVQRTIR